MTRKDRTEGIYNRREVLDESERRQYCLIQLKDLLSYAYRYSEDVKKRFDRAQFKAKIHALPIADLTPNLLSSLKAQLLKTPTGNTKPKKATKKPKAKAPTRKMLAGQTVNNIFSFMRSAINRAVATGMWSGVNPLSTKGGTWKMVKANNERLRFLTREEAKSLLDDLEKRHPQLHDMALLSLRTGLRPTEIFKLAGRMWTAMPAASISFRRE